MSKILQWLQKMTKDFFGMQYRKNKNMTTFQIVLSKPKKSLVVTRQKLRAAYFLHNEQYNFLYQVKSYCFTYRNFYDLSRVLRQVLTFNLS